MMSRIPLIITSPCPPNDHSPLSQILATVMKYIQVSYNCPLADEITSFTLMYIRKSHCCHLKI